MRPRRVRGVVPGTDVPCPDGRPRGDACHDQRVADPPSAGHPALDVDEAVFDAVEEIPPGRVSTYGAIGRLVGVGPRRVARALSQGGGAVPWYRVVRADGSMAEPVRVRQMELLAAEGVPVRNGKVVLAAVGWPG
nr:MGMT family protein [Blastococcus saxobsidens]